MMSCRSLVALQHFLHAARDGVMLFADNLGRERLRGRSERIDRRINAELGDRALEHDGRIKVREGVGRAPDRSDRPPERKPPGPK